MIRAGKSLPPSLRGGKASTGVDTVASAHNCVGQAPPACRVIGINEIAIAKGHQYRIVVTNLERGRPIWFGDKDRSAASLDEFFAWLGPKKCGKIRLAVMDM